MTIHAPLHTSALKGVDLTFASDVLYAHACTAFRALLLRPCIESIDPSRMEPLSDAVHQDGSGLCLGPHSNQCSNNFVTVSRVGRVVMRVGRQRVALQMISPWPAFSQSEQSPGIS